MAIYVAKRPLKSYKICNIFFEHGLIPSPLFEQCSKKMRIWRKLASLTLLQLLKLNGSIRVGWVGLSLNLASRGAGSFIFQAGCFNGGNVTFNQYIDRRGMGRVQKPRHGNLPQKIMQIVVMIMQIVVMIMQIVVMIFQGKTSISIKSWTNLPHRDLVVTQEMKLVIVKGETHDFLESVKTIVVRT